VAKHELLIARLPGRTGLYLGFHEGTTWTTVARFTRGEESAKQFVEWAKKAGINYEDTAKENDGTQERPV
jgi:hypothetical protein